VAIIRVGAATESEMKERKARVEAALHATRAAIEEGIVREGVWPSCAQVHHQEMDLQGDEGRRQILLHAIESP
jgi:chaperonin GroEL